MEPMTVVSTFPVSAEHVDTMRAGLSQVVTSMRAADGCLGFDLYESESAPGVFVTIARWTDKEHFVDHLASPETREALTAAQAMLDAPPAVHPLLPVVVTG